MSLVTTHVLNITVGEPAEGVRVILEFRETATQPWVRVGEGRTDAHGRLQNLLPEDNAAKPGVYCLRFDTAPLSPFFPEVVVQFVISDLHRHYHVPLLLGRFGYSTYRGS